MNDLTQLYQDIILSHNKRPHHYGAPEGDFEKAEKNNPLCGDEITVYWKFKDDRISVLNFTSQGCAISRASASIMTDLLNGKTVGEVEAIFEQFQALLESSETSEEGESALGELVALSGVRQYPSRIKCATLAWLALLEELRQAPTGGS